MIELFDADTNSREKNNNLSSIIVAMLYRIPIRIM